MSDVDFHPHGELRVGFPSSEPENSLRIDTAAAERERALREEVGRLRGKCNRLIEAIAETSNHPSFTRSLNWGPRALAMGLDVADLDYEPGGIPDPEPHGAASEPTPDEGTRGAE